MSPRSSSALNKLAIRPVVCDLYVSLLLLFTSAHVLAYVRLNQNIWYIVDSTTTDLKTALKKPGTRFKSSSGLVIYLVVPKNEGLSNLAPDFEGVQATLFCRNADAAVLRVITIRNKYVIYRSA